MKARLKQLNVAAQAQWQLAGVRNLVGGGMVGIAVTLGNRVIVLTSAVILARLLGPDGYGTYAFAIAIMAILSVGTEFGMYSLLVREVSVAHSSGDYATVRGLRNNAFRFALISSGVIAIVGTLLLWTTPLVSDTVSRLTLTIMLMILPLNSLIRLSSAIMAGLRKISWSQIIELFLMPAIFLSGLTVLILVGPVGLTPDTPMLLFFAGAAVALCVVLFVLARGLGQMNNGAREPARRIPGLQARARPFLLISAAGMITGQVDTALVGAFLDNSDTALYRVAAQGATLIWFGIQILQSISAPYFARLHSSGDVVKLRQLFTITTIASVISALPVFGAFFFFGEQLIGLVFGVEYVGAYPLLIILAVGYLVNVCCGPVGSLLSMTGNERFVSRALVVSSVINLVMALALLQVFGASGVAMSTGFSVAFYHVILRVYAWRRYRM